MRTYDSSFWQGKRVVALSGGIGGARLVHGLMRCLPPNHLTAIINTGDDVEHLGVWVSPDCDTVMYTLADLAPVDRGWGVVDDTDQAMAMVARLQGPTWFNLGDRDLGTNLLRTSRMRRGDTLTAITEDFTQALGVPARLLPMADTPHATFIHTTDGRRLGFQEWLVGERGAPSVAQVELEGDGQATDAVLDALDEADLIVLPPSNPWVSIDPILRLRGVRERVLAKPVIGVSPIVHGHAVKGPLSAMIPSLMGIPPSAAAVATHYGEILDHWIVAPGDSTGCTTPTTETDIMMDGIAGRDRLASEVLAAAEDLLRRR